MTNPPAEPTAPRKFMFDLSFDNAAIIHRAAERKPVLMKPEQIDALKQEGYNAGFEAGKGAGREAQTAELTAVLANVERNIVGLMQNLAVLRQEQDKQTRELVLAIARKIIPDYATRNGLQEIEAVLSDAIRDMAREPRLVVRVNEQQFDAVNEKAQAIAAQRAYSGTVIVLADPTIIAGDCRVEWADGGVERDAQATWKAVEETVNPSV